MYKVIKSELEAKSAANYIFKNVANPGCDYIGKEQPYRFLIAEEVSLLLTQFEGAAKTEKILESEFKKWVVSFFLSGLSQIVP